MHELPSGFGEGSLMAQSAVQGPWLSVATVADELDVSKGTVYGWVRDGLLANVALPGRLVRVSRDDLDDFIRSRRHVAVGRPRR